MPLNLYQMDPKICDEYADTKIEKVNFDKVFELVKNTAAKKESVEILDLCCGTGILPRKWLIKLANIKYTGVDINNDFINFAKRNLKDKRFQFILHDATTFRPKEKFDIILATSSYHHIPDGKKRKFLKNIRDLLKDDGVFIVYEKIVNKFSDSTEEIDAGTMFYLERIKYMLNTEKLSENQVFALFNEQYLTSIRKDEYKVDFEYFKKDIEASKMKIEKHIKLWPEKNIFKNHKIGDFIFLIKKLRIARLTPTCLPINRRGNS